MDDVLFDLDQARDYLAARGIDVTREALRQWHYRGKGPRVTWIEHFRRFKRTDIDAWLKLESTGGKSVVGDSTEDGITAAPVRGMGGADEGRPAP